MNDVVPAGLVVGRAQQLARTVAVYVPLVVKVPKSMMPPAAGAEPASDRDLWRQDREMAVLLESWDAVEGARVFAEKREPGWVGR